MNRRSARMVSRDSGLTLVELLLVTVMMGLIVAVISAAILTVLRVAPTTAFRIDDARSTRGLQTWLIRDAASTPPQAIASGSDGYVFTAAELASSGATLCAGNPATLVLHMQWSEASDVYSVTYHIDGNRIVRSLCGDHSGENRLTSNVSTTPCSGWVQFALPVAASSPPPDVESIQLCVLSLEADSGLNAGGGAQQEIHLSVSSRNRA